MQQQTSKTHVESKFDNNLIKFNIAHFQSIAFL